MQMQQQKVGIEIRTAAYRLVFDRDALLVRLDALNAPFYYCQSMISSIDTIEGIDVTNGLPEIRAREDAGRIKVEIELASDLWRRKVMVYICENDRIRCQLHVEGHARIDRVYFFRGALRDNQLASMPGFDWVYPACTNFLDKELFHVSEYTSINAGHEGFAWGYALASGPLCFALGNQDQSPWLSVGVVPRTGQWGFQSVEFNHLPEAVRAEPDSLVGTQAFSLAYHGHEVVNGEWRSPELVMQFSPDRHAAVESYVDHLYASGALQRPRSGGSTPSWWTGPIFCGWHEQVRLGFPREHARLSRSYLESGARAQAACTQVNYQRWLDVLDAKDCRPGTVIIDALWQVSPDLNQADADKWPDLRGFVDACHARGQHVLLWLDIWKHRLLPEDECARKDGMCVCGDPTNPKYLQRLRREIHYMLSADAGCLNADGFKVDGQTLQPYGYDFQALGGIYGFALQKTLLEFIHHHAKQEKTGALISLFSANPYFADVCDMVRLGDLYSVRGDPLSTMRRRARLIRAGMPGKLIDTDGAMRFNLAATLESLVEQQVNLGVPTIYNAEEILAHRVFCLPSVRQLTDDDYQTIARAFQTRS